MKNSLCLCCLPIRVLFVYYCRINYTIVVKKIIYFVFLIFLFNFNSFIVYYYTTSTFSVICQGNISHLYLFPSCPMFYFSFILSTKIILIAFS